MFLAALDQTIVGPVLPTIVTQLNGADLYTWVVTIFLLTSTVTVPIYGKLSDLYGRRPLLLFGISLFLVGSFLSGLSQTMWQLILFRGIQGLGAGALFPIALATIGDLFTPAERGKYQGLFGAVFGIAFLVGPAPRRLPHRPPQLALDLLRQHPDRARGAGRDRPAAAEHQGPQPQPEHRLPRCRHPHRRPRADPGGADRRGDVHLERPVGLGHGPDRRRSSWAPSSSSRTAPRSRSSRCTCSGTAPSAPRWSRSSSRPSASARRSSSCRSTSRSSAERPRPSPATSCCRSCSA